MTSPTPRLLGWQHPPWGDGANGGTGSTLWRDRLSLERAYFPLAPQLPDDAIPRVYNSWGIPAPDWFNRDWYASSVPLMPESGRAISQQCASELIHRNYCQSDAACQLGVAYSMDPSAVQLAGAHEIDAARFAAGSRMHQRCVRSATEDMLDV